MIIDPGTETFSASFWCLSVSGYHRFVSGYGSVVTIGFSVVMGQWLL